jgi:hypothetical protein
MHYDYDYDNDKKQDTKSVLKSIVVKKKKFAELLENNIFVLGHKDHQDF